MVVKDNTVQISGRVFNLDEIVDYNAFVLLGYSPKYAAAKNTEFRKAVGTKKLYTYQDLVDWLNDDNSSKHKELTQSEFHDMIEEICRTIIMQHPLSSRKDTANPADPNLRETIKRVCKEYRVSTRLISRILI